jgi:signal transduction histidine kinase
MSHYRQALTFGIGLIACCLLIIGVVVSRQLTRLAADEEGIQRDNRVTEAYRMRRLILLSLMLTGVGGIVVTVQVRSEVRRRQRLEVELRRALEDVDARVRERTRELSLANEQLKAALDERAAACLREQQSRTAAERANELKDRFLSTVSHELRTPLNAIVGWIHVMRIGSMSGAQTEHALEAIDRNAHAQDHLITELLDVSHMIQGRLVVTRVDTDLRQPVDRAVESARLAARAKGVRLDYRRHPDALHVRGDDERLQQVAVNLLSNAVKFTPGGGSISVELEPADSACAEIRVRDSGEGIEPEALGYVFDPFFQGKTTAMRKGMGLGLAIVKEIVALHGGTVAVASDGRGQGAAFTVRVPLAPAESPASAGDPQPI